MKHAAATLGSGNLRLAVLLPEGEDLNEWVAVNSKLNEVTFIIEFLFNFFIFNCFLFSAACSATVKSKFMLSWFIIDHQQNVLRC